MFYDSLKTLIKIGESALGRYEMFKSNWHIKHIKLSITFICKSVIVEYLNVITYKLLYHDLGISKKYN